MSKYYIWASDPHGIGQAWINLVQQAQHDYPNAQTVFGGDYIDGNKSAKETISFIKNQVQHHHAIALLGNHEQLMHDFVEYNDPTWYINGAKTTVKSLFGRGFSKRKTQQLLRSNDNYIFLVNLPIAYETPHLLFVHAGLTQNELNDPNWHVNLDHNRINSDPNVNTHLWAREDYWYNPTKNHTFAHNHRRQAIVTGHTPTMFLNGEYNGPSLNHELGIIPTANIYDENEDFVHRPCPVIPVQYAGEYPRYFTDDGCHGANQHHGNICVFHADGKLIKVYNDDPKEQPYNWKEDA